MHPVQETLHPCQTKSQAKPNLYKDPSIPLKTSCLPLSSRILPQKSDPSYSLWYLASSLMRLAPSLCSPPTRPAFSGVAQQRRRRTHTVGRSDIPGRRGPRTHDRPPPAWCHRRRLVCRWLTNRRFESESRALLNSPPVSKVTMSPPPLHRGGMRPTVSGLQVHDTWHDD